MQRNMQPCCPATMLIAIATWRYPSLLHHTVHVHTLYLTILYYPDSAGRCEARRPTRLPLGFGHKTRTVSTIHVSSRPTQQPTRIWSLANGRSLVAIANVVRYYAGSFSSRRLDPSTVLLSGRYDSIAISDAACSVMIFLLAALGPANSRCQLSAMALVRRKTDKRAAPRTTQCPGRILDSDLHRAT